MPFWYHQNNSSFGLDNHLASVLRVVVVLSYAVASRDASVLEGVLVGQHHTGLAKALGFATAVTYSAVVAESVHLARVRVCSMGGWREEQPERVAGHLEEHLFGTLAGSQR